MPALLAAQCVSEVFAEETKLLLINASIAFGVVPAQGPQTVSGRTDPKETGRSAHLLKRSRDVNTDVLGALGEGGLR